MILRSPFWVDLRGLAVLRILTALIVLADLLGRAPSLDALYTDAGILPRGVVASHLWLPSVYWWAADLWQVAALFALTAVCAVWLLLGWKTRLATFATWALMLSLHNRNPAVFHAGDSVLSLVLFWLLLLPAGARLSLDARRSPPRSNLFHAPGLVVQFVLIFFCAVDFKLMGESWRKGYAVRETLSVSFYAQPLAHSLLAYPRLLTALSWLTIAGEAFVPVAILCLWRQPFFRGAAVAVAIATQLAFGLFLKVGIFPWITSAYALSLAPGWFWDRFWPEPQIAPEKSRLFTKLLTGVALSLVMVWNFGEAGATYGAGTPLNDGWPGRLTALIGLRQRWSMFAPNVQTEDGHFAVAALGTQGTLDVLPQMVGKPLGDSLRWTLVFLDLLQADSPHLAHGIGRYGCVVANRGGAYDVITIRYTHFDHLPDGGTTGLEYSELLREPCPHLR